MNEQDRKEFRKFWEDKKYPEIADAIWCLKQSIDELNQKKAALQEQFDILTMEVVPDKMAEDGMSNMKLADGSRLELRQSAFCSTRAGMKENLFQWMRDNGFEDLITEVVNPSTLKSFIKEQLGAGNDVPDDSIVNYQPYTRATLVGRK